MPALKAHETLQIPFWAPQPRRPGQQGPINRFFLTFKLAVCQPSNPPNAPNAFWAPQPPRPSHQRPINSFFLAFKPAVCQPSNPSKLSNAFLGAPTQQAEAFLTFKPAVCQPSKPTKRSKCLSGRHNPAGQGTKAPSLAWRSSLPFASPQTLQTLQMPFWQPQLRRPGQQGPINSFFLAFKPAVCQPSKPTKRSKCLFGSPNPAGQGTKAPSLAFSWRSSLPFASPETLQTLQMPFWAPQSIPFASPQTLQTLQTLQMPFWQPQPRRPRHQGPINSFFLAFKPAVCQPSKPTKRSKCLFGSPNPAGSFIFLFLYSCSFIYGDIYVYIQSMRAFLPLP